jgi:hypothetical protein
MCDLPQLLGSTSPYPTGGCNNCEYQHAVNHCHQTGERWLRNETYDLLLARTHSLVKVCDASVRCGWVPGEYVVLMAALLPLAFEV